MRITDLIEGIRMGAKDLAQPTKKNYTIGFEYEVELNSGYPGEGSLDSGDIDYDAASEAHLDEWYSRSNFDFDEWFKDYMRWSYPGKIAQFIIDNDFEPKYGWVDNADDYIEQLNADVIISYNRNKTALENKIKDYDQEFINQFKNFYDNEYKYNREEIINDIDKIKEYVLFFQTNSIKFKNRYPDEADRLAAVKAELERSHDTRIKFIFANNVENLHNIFYQEIPEPSLYTEEDDEYTDFDPDDKEYIYDEYKNMIEIEDEINDVEDLEKYFNVDEDEIRDSLENEWNEAESDARSEDFNDWIQYNASRFTEGGEGLLGYVRSQVHTELNNNWTIKEDSSLSNGAEIESEVFKDLSGGIQSMHEVFELIKNDPYMNTSSRTGLHVNIGTWKGDEINSVDWLKFLIVYKADRVLEEFNRISNTYAPDKLDEIISALEHGNLKPFYQDINSINSQIIGSSRKYSSVNLSKLGTYGIIELRAPGNTGYETKGDYLDREIRKIGRALDIASDPNAYKTEYAKKLYKLLSAKTNRRLGRSENPEQNPVDDFFKQISNGIAPEYKFLGASRIINYIIENSNNFNEAAANSKYTARVHKLVMDDLKEFQRINGSDVTQIFDRYLNKYDTDGKIRNSTFMRMIYKSLNR